MVGIPRVSCFSPNNSFWVSFSASCLGLGSDMLELMVSYSCWPGMRAYACISPPAVYGEKGGGISPQFSRFVPFLFISVALFFGKIHKGTPITQERGKGVNVCMCACLYRYNSLALEQACLCIHGNAT